MNKQQDNSTIIYQVTSSFRIEYEKDDKRITVDGINSVHDLNLQLKWIRSKYYDSIRIFRTLRVIVPSTEQIYTSKVNFTLDSYDSSPLKYAEFWGKVHADQAAEIQKLYPEYNGC